MTRLPLRDRAFLEGIFGLLCTSRLNAIYYEMRLTRIQKENFLIEIVISSTASGSAVAGLGVWHAPFGQWIWAALAITAAVASIVKPIYAPNKKVELFTRQRQSYHNNYFALQKLIYLLQQSSVISDEFRKRFETIFDRHVQLSGEDEPAVKARVLRKAEERCSKALPPEAFWQHWADRATSTVTEGGHANSDQGECSETNP